MLSEKDMRDIFPYYKADKYRGIDTSPGTHVLSRGMSKSYVIEIDLQEAMRETQRKYEILDKYSDGALVFLEYVVYE